MLGGWMGGTLVHINSVSLLFVQELAYEPRECIVQVL